MKSPWAEGAAMQAEAERQFAERHDRLMRLCYDEFNGDVHDAIRFHLLAMSWLCGRSTYLVPEDELVQTFTDHFRSLIRSARAHT